MCLSVSQQPQQLVAEWYLLYPSHIFYPYHIPRDLGFLRIPLFILISSHLPPTSSRNLSSKNTAFSRNLSSKNTTFPRNCLLRIPPHLEICLLRIPPHLAICLLRIPPSLAICLLTSKNTTFSRNLSSKQCCGAGAGAAWSRHF